jgi:hypothetical protein
MSASPPEYTPDMMESFKYDVRMWLEIDNAVRVLQKTMQERRNEKRALASRILSFMGRYKIDDLNTPVGRLRSSTARVKVPLSHQEILARIASYHESDVIAAQQLRAALFGSCEHTERTSIRRIAWRP